MRLKSAIHSALLLLSAILIVEALAQAYPASSQSWSEEPWDGQAQESWQEGPSTISEPAAFNISGSEPRKISLGSWQINYTDLSSSSGASALWIRDNDTWRQHSQVLAGDGLDVIAFVPESGSADIYLISYANSSIVHSSLRFLGGYHLLRFSALQEGRTFIILAKDGQPSNALIIDVLPRVEQSIAGPLDVVQAAAPGRAKVTVVSDRTKGYDVYVDGVFYSSDIADGSMDGKATFVLARDGTHTITISQRDGQGGIINKNEHTKEFQRNMAYTLKIG